MCARALYTRAFVCERETTDRQAGRERHATHLVLAESVPGPQRNDVDGTGRVSLYYDRSVGCRASRPFIPSTPSLALSPTLPFSLSPFLPFYRNHFAGHKLQNPRAVCMQFFFFV